MIATGSRKRLAAPARQDSILSAAISEFAHTGYERTRVADIASRVGVTEPVVFQNFGTKAGLFAAVLERASGQLVRYLQSVHKGVHDVAELVAVLDEHHDRLHAHGGLGLIFAEAHERLEPSIKHAVRRAHSQMIQAVAELLHQGQREGTIRKDVDAVTLAGLVISQIRAHHFRRTYGETSQVLEQALRTAVLAALRPQPRVPSRATGRRRTPRQPSTPRDEAGRHTGPRRR